MSLALKEDESLSDAFRRIFAEGIEDALRAVDSPKRAKRSQAVHESRKRLKELRAALRLVRPALGDKWFEEENAALRDLARPLSAVRDAQVMLDTLDKLKDHFKEELSKDAFAQVRQALARRRREIVAATVEEQGALRTSAEGLHAVQQRVAKWPLAEMNWDAVIAGLAHIYDQGRSAMRVALEGHDDLALHEWRKRAKDLRHQMEILKPVWPALLCATADEAHTLGDKLGDDHDLAVLSDLLDGELHEAIPKHDRQALAALIERRRQTLQKHARRLGARLYAEKPKDFSRRIAAYAQAAEL